MFGRYLMLLLLLITTACARGDAPVPSSSDRDAAVASAVEAVDDEIIAAMGSGDWEAYHAHMSEHVVWMVPDGASLRGWSEIGPYLAEFGAVRDFAWSDRVITGSGDLAIRTLHFVMRTDAPDPGAEIRYPGKMLTVYRRRDDGEWMVEVEIWNRSPA